MLKRGSGTCHEWLGAALADLKPEDVRIAGPVPTRGGAWQHAGWTASEWVEGVGPTPPSTAAWSEVLAAGRAFHRAVAHLARSACLDERSDAWAVADRAAWGERPWHLHRSLTEVARRLVHALEPPGPSQLVHGDLTTNVLVASGLPPAVIDLSLYWRPPEFAEGVVLADALCWHGAPPSLLTELGVPVAAVARGLLFRMLTTSARVALGELPVTDLVDEAHRYDAAASAIGV